MPPGSMVAYFCAEFAITDKLPIYSGGLGVLAGDIVQEAAERNMPFVAVGLFYKYGYFHQHVDMQGQHESRSAIDPVEAGLELLKGSDGETLLIPVPINERTVWAQVWRFPVGSVSLYLLDTDHWKNSEFDRTITDQLYSGDTGKRIMQELVLGVGGFRMLSEINIAPTVYHMNEGHSAFLSLELTQTLMAGGLDRDAAKARAKQMLIFTNHTLVPAGNDAFEQEQICYYLGKYANDGGMGIDEVLGLGSGDGKFSMTMLAMRMARVSNAVSRLHADKALSLWPDFHLASVTNGVHLPVWIAPELQDLYTKHAPHWRKEASNMKAWIGARRIEAPDLWETHKARKQMLLDEVYERTGVRLNPDALTVVWARRFATYKRPDLLFADIERLKKLLFSSDRPIQIIVSGKSHPADGQGKDIIKHIENLSHDVLEHRAVFVEDYTISLAKYLVSGADIWLNTPIFGLEASGTSGMKASANGVVQFTTPDGWAYEVDWYGMGYTVPLEHADTGIYDIFENEIIPEYYTRDAAGIPTLWVAKMRETIASVAPEFSSQRMVNDYIELYTEHD
jgi:glycogen phosphorylase